MATTRRHSAGTRAYGIEHVGITVPDMDQATAFFVGAFAAEVLYDLIVPTPDGSVPAGAAPPEVLERMLGTARGAGIGAVRMLRIGHSANIELFHYVSEDQRPCARPSDLGLQHFSILVDDIAVAGERVVAAGGAPLEGPLELPGLEAGDGNRFWYTRTPWGSTIELIELASPQEYEAQIAGRRWRPAVPDS